MKKYYTIIVLLAIVFSISVHSQVEFRKDSIHLFQWDNNSDDWRHNTREYLTYNNGGVNESNLRRQFLSGSNWVNFYQFNKIYTSRNQLEENIQQNWNDPNSGWNDKYKHEYVFDENQNETLHQYSLYYNGGWQNYQRDIKSYVDNYLDIKTMEQYDFVSMQFISEEQYLYYYVDDLLDYEIKRIYFSDVMAWENDEKIGYTYNLDGYLTDIEHFGFNSSTNMFSEFPYLKTVNTYNSEGLIEESITQVWATSQYLNTERYTYSYINGNITELVNQKWFSTDNVWVNNFRHVKVYDDNNNEIEFIYENWNTSSTPDAWKGFLRIVNFWSPSVTLSTDNFNKETEIVIYPNPAINYINITSAQKINTIELYDLLGKQVLKTSQTNQIDVSNLHAGLYLLKIHTRGKTLTKKVIIK